MCSWKAGSLDWQTEKKNAARNLLCIESIHLAEILISVFKEAAFMIQG